MSGGYTKGPWAANDQHSGANAWRVEVASEAWSNDGWIIAECLGPDAKANARLIAAAPCLVEALRESHEVLSAMFVEGPVDVAFAGNPHQCDALEAQARAVTKTARALLAKIDGEKA